jgi:hypothetical protein
MREPYEDWQAPRPKPLTIKLVRTQTQASIVIVQTDTPGADDQQQPGLECWSSTNASAARPPIGCLRTAPCRPQREPRLWRSFAPACRVKGASIRLQVNRSALRQLIARGACQPGSRAHRRRLQRP